MATVANEKTASAALHSAADSTFQNKSSFWALTLGSVGVVYGDIGTSPLYAFREAVAAAVGSGTFTRDIVLGVFGASMFLGDSVITPAISVLSAVEGLKLVTPTFDHSVVPLTIGILIGLFAAQSRGTARVASFFAPVMVTWFGTIALAGLLHIHDDPGVLAAINPSYAITFLYD